jgi:hypothetical protein
MTREPEVFFSLITGDNTLEDFNVAAENDRSLSIVGRLINSLSFIGKASTNMRTITV